MLVTLLGVMTVLVLVQAGLRYLFETPLAWSEEVTRYLFVYSIFIGAAVGIRHQVHVSIDAVLSRMPDRWRLLAHRASVGIVALFLLFLVVLGLRLALWNMSQTSPALGIPIGLAYLAVPVGGLLAMAFVLGPKREVRAGVGGKA